MILKTWLQTIIVAAAFVLVAPAAHAQAPFTSLGAPVNETLVGEPSCLTWPATNTWVACFARGASGGIWRIGSMDGVTFESGWRPLGGALFSDPTCVSTTWPHVHCFATFRDQALWRRRSSNGGRDWSDWEQVRDDVRGRPSCFAANATTVDCFGIASDLNVYRIRLSGTTTQVTPVGVGPGSQGGSFALSGSGAVVMPGPECVQRHDANGTGLGVICFARKTNGQLWTTTLATNPAPDPTLQWTQVTSVATFIGEVQCFDHPGGRIDCIASNGNGTSVRHFSNVSFPSATSSGGLFFESLSTPGHNVPIRCFPAAGRPNLECVVVAWPQQTLPPTPPFELNRFVFDGNTATWSTQNLGGDVRSAVSCVPWAQRPNPVTLQVADTQCFAVGAAGDLVYRRLDPPLQVEILRPPGGEIRRCRPGTPGCP